jgi:hypothetical protein
MVFGTFALGGLCVCIATAPLKPWLRQLWAWRERAGYFWGYNLRTNLQDAEFISALDTNVPPTPPPIDPPAKFDTVFQT